LRKFRGRKLTEAKVTAVWDFLPLGGRKLAAAMLANEDENGLEIINETKERLTFLRSALEIILNTRMETNKLSPSLGKLGVRVASEKILDGLVNLDRGFLESRKMDELNLMAEGRLKNKSLR
jgi:hypothetical protein